MRQKTITLTLTCGTLMTNAVIMTGLLAQPLGIEKVWVTGRTITRDSL